MLCSMDLICRLTPALAAMLGVGRHRPCNHSSEARSRFLAVCAVLTGSLLSLNHANGAEPASLLQGFERMQLLVVMEGRPVCRLFEVYVAATTAQKAQGLMHVRKLEWHEGMIFQYAEPREITMWMKNTLIPLDMLFIDPQGQIGHIEAETEPESEAIIRSRITANAVLELRGGAAALFGIATGDRIIFPAG